MRKPNKNKMAGVNSRFASVSESIFNGFLLKMLLRSLPVYILKQLFFSISVNSGRIFTSPLRGSVNILPLFTSISKNNCLILPHPYYSEGNFNILVIGRLDIQIIRNSKHGNATVTQTEFQLT